MFGAETARRLLRLLRPAPRIPPSRTQRCRYETRVRSPSAIITNLPRKSAENAGCRGGESFCLPAPGAGSRRAVHGSLSRTVGTASPSPRAREPLWLVPCAPRRHEPHASSCSPLRASFPVMLSFGRRLPVLSARPRATSLALFAASRRTRRAREQSACMHAYAAGLGSRCTFRCSPARLSLSRSWDSSEGRLGAVLALRVRLPALSHELLELAFAAEKDALLFRVRVDMFRLPLSFSRTVACSSSPSRGPPSSCRRQPRLGGVATSSEIVDPAVLRPVFVSISARVGRARGSRGVLCTASSAARSACCRSQPPLADIAHRQLDCRARCAGRHSVLLAQECTESAGCAVS